RRATSRRDAMLSTVLALTRTSLKRISPAPIYAPAIQTHKFDQRRANQWAISDRAYADGIDRLERELSDESAPHVRPDHLCLMTIRGDKSRSAPGSVEYTSVASANALATPCERPA